mgnify:CR=1 FL=1
MNKPLFLKLSFLLITLVLVFSCKEKTKYESINQNENGFISSKEIPDSYFLGDNNCKECHQQEFKDWQGSHHDKAMQKADSLTILADFNNKTFTSQGVTSRFYKKGKDKLIRNYGIGAQIIKDLKIKNMTLISKSPKKVIGLDGYGIRITKQEII